jgi:hypothetical protein
VKGRLPVSSSTSHATGVAARIAGMQTGQSRRSRRSVALVGRRSCQSACPRHPHEQMLARWDARSCGDAPGTWTFHPISYADDEQRNVALGAYICWKGSRHSVPWHCAGKEVSGAGTRVPLGRDPLSAERIAAHAPAMSHHQVITPQAPAFTPPMSSSPISRWPRRLALNLPPT